VTCRIYELRTLYAWMDDTERLLYSCRSDDWQASYINYRRIPGDRFPSGDGLPYSRGSLTGCSYRTTREDADVVRTAFRNRLCGCGHDRGAHRHYRYGSDCALCDCPQWSTPCLICQLVRRLWRLAS
jgi:hypothetical protein